MSAMRPRVRFPSRSLARGGLALAVLCGAGWSSPAHAQAVSIDPQIIVVTGASGFATILLANADRRAAEVVLRLEYAEAGVDSTGRNTIVFRTAEATDPDATRHLSLFPRRVQIPAGGTQTVRLAVRTPPPVGVEHWARLIVTSRAVTVADSAPLATRIGVELETRTVLPVFLRVGTPTAGLALDSARVDVIGVDSLEVRVHAQRRGTAAWIGQLRPVIAGVTLPAFPTAVYGDAWYRFRLARPATLGEQLAIVIAADAGRPNLPTAVMVPTTGTVLRVELPSPPSSLPGAPPPR
jgi:P pilus assembly chaperone PapD